MEMEKKTPERSIFIIWRWKEKELGLWRTAQEENHLHSISEENLFEDNLAAMADTLRAHPNLPQCLFFLHRKRHPVSYVGQLLQTLKAQLGLNDTGKLKCFLFGYGSDYLYLSKNPNGLLGDGALGGFVEDKDGATKEYHVIQDAKQRTIREENFNAIWRYYQHEFKKKLYQLERDLFLHFSPFTDPEYPGKNGSLFAHLETNSALALRLYSFIGEDIEAEEAVEHQELLFDDCSENLKAAYGLPAMKAYETLKQHINGVFLGNSLHRVPPHIAIPEVRQQFVQLRSTMPERITY